jgi:competence protein ComEA
MTHTHPSVDSRSVAYALLLMTLLVVDSACVKRARGPEPPAVTTANEQHSADSTKSKPQLVNINTASANELETLPGIGKALAERIIEHREKFGPFRRTEHLIIVRGISDKRFRALREFIAVE